MKKIFSAILVLLIVFGSMPLNNTYANDYQKSIISNRAPLSISVAPNTTTVNVNTSFTVTAKYGGGTAPYLFAFYVYKDNKVEYKGGYAKTNVFRYTPKTAGKYMVIGFVRDALGTIKTAKTTTINVTANTTSPLFILPSMSRSSIYNGDEVLVSAKASGGAGGPYKYAFYVYRGTDLIDKTSYVARNVLWYRPTSPGKYRFSCFVMDKAGNRTVRSTNILSVIDAPIYRVLAVGQEDYKYEDILKGSHYSALRVSSKFYEKYPYARIYSDVLLDATRYDIINGIQTTFRYADENSVSIFYYIGRGSVYGELIGTNGSYITPTQLAYELNRIPGKIVVMLDASYSGYHINKSNDVRTEDNLFNESIIDAFKKVNVYEKSPGQLATSKFHVITSSTQYTHSYYPYDGSGGYFSRGLLKAIDRNYDGFINMHEAYLTAYNEGIYASYYSTQYAQCYPENDQLVIWKR